MQNSTSSRKYLKESIRDDDAAPVIVNLVSGVCGIIQTEEAKDSCFSGNDAKSPRPDEDIFRERERFRHHTTRNHRPVTELHRDHIMGITCSEYERLERGDLFKYRTSTAGSNSDGSYHQIKEKEYEKFPRNSGETRLLYSRRCRQDKKSDVFRKIRAVTPKDVDARDVFGTHDYNCYDSVENARYTKRTREPLISGTERSHSANKKHVTTVFKHTPIPSSKLKLSGHSGQENVVDARKQVDLDIHSFKKGHETKKHMLSNFTRSKNSVPYCDDSEEQFDYKLYKKEKESSNFGKREFLSTGKTSPLNKLHFSVCHRPNISADINRRGESRCSSREGSLYSPSRKRTTAIPSHMQWCSSSSEVPSVSDIFQRKIASIHYRSPAHINSDIKYVRAADFQVNKTTSEAAETEKMKSSRRYEKAELMDSMLYERNRSDESERAASVEPMTAKHSVEVDVRNRKQPCYTNTVSISITPAADQKERFLSTVGVPVGKASREKTSAKYDLHCGLRDAESNDKTRQPYLAKSYFIQDLEQILRLLTNTTMGSMEWNRPKHLFEIPQFLPKEQTETQYTSQNGLYGHRTSITHDITSGKINEKSEMQLPRQEVLGETSSTFRSVGYVDASLDRKESSGVLSVSESLAKKFSGCMEPVMKASRQQAFHKFPHAIAEQFFQERSAERDLGLVKVPEFTVPKNVYKRVSLKVKLYPQLEDKVLSREIDETNHFQISRQISPETIMKFEPSREKSVHGKVLMPKDMYSEYLRLCYKNSEEILKCQSPLKLGFITSSMLGSVPFDTHSDILLEVLSFSKRFQISSSKADPFREKCISSPNILQTGGNIFGLKRQVLKGRFQIHWMHNLLIRMLCDDSGTPYQNDLGHESYTLLERDGSEDVFAEDRKLQDFAQRFKFYVKQFLSHEGEANVTAAGEANVTAAGEANVTAAGEANVTAAGEANVTAAGQKVEEKSQKRSLGDKSNRLTPHALLHLSESEDQDRRDKSFREDNLSILGDVRSGASSDVNAEVRKSTELSRRVLMDDSVPKPGLSTKSKNERTGRGETVSRPESDIYKSWKEIPSSYNGKSSEASLPALIHLYEAKEEEDTLYEKQNDQDNGTNVLSTVSSLLGEIMEDIEEGLQLQSSLSSVLSTDASESKFISELREYIDGEDENEKGLEVFAGPYKRHTWHGSTSEELRGISQPTKCLSDFQYCRRSDDNNLYSLTDSSIGSQGHDDNLREKFYIQKTGKTDHKKVKDSLASHGSLRRGVQREIDQEYTSEDKLNWDEFDEAQSSRDALSYKKTKLTRREEKFKDTSVWLKNHLGGLKSEGFRYLEPEKFSAVKKR